jgi:hypothetical protein
VAASPSRATTTLVAAAVGVTSRAGDAAPVVAVASGGDAGTPSWACSASTVAAVVGNGAREVPVVPVVVAGASTASSRRAWSASTIAVVVIDAALLGVSSMEALRGRSSASERMDMSGQNTARTELKLPARRRPRTFILPNARRSCSVGRRHLKSAPAPLHGLHSTQQKAILRRSIEYRLRAGEDLVDHLDAVGDWVLWVVVMMIGGSNSVYSVLE